jgi:N-acylneuraminate cytidylyltransferase
LRPPKFAQDESLDREVYRHALEWLAEHEGYDVDYLVSLRPTAPLRLPRHIDEAVEMALATEADVVKAVVEAHVHPHKSWRIVEGVLEPFVDSNLWDSQGPDLPRQALEPVYWQNGIVDVWRASVILSPPASYRTVRFVPYLVDRRYVVDLDYEEDFEVAEVMLKHRDRLAAGM